MDRVTDLAEIVKREVGDYAGPAYKAKTYYVEDEKHQVYTVITVPDHDYPISLKAGITIMVRVVGDKVVIEQDITDRPLYQALVEAGIPREQIILAYAGETLPEQRDETA